MTTVEYFFRTHFWNDATQFIFERQQASVGQKVIALCDESNGVIEVPEGVTKIAIRNEHFQRAGLPLFPDPARTQWWNGDYAIFAALLASPADYLVINEYDVVLPQRFNALVDIITSEGVDLVAHMLLPTRNGNWYWRTNIADWYASEFGLNPDDVDRIGHACNLPTIIISRTLALDLLSRRIEMARKYRKNPGVWLFCEAFVATESFRLGARLKKLGDLLDTSNFTTARPLDGTKLVMAPHSIYHPVLFGEHFRRKLQVWYTQQFGDMAQEFLARDGYAP